MSEYDQFQPPRVMPKSLRWVRGLLYAVGILGVLSAVLYVALFETGAEELGALTWGTWPSVVALFLARRVHRGNRKTFIWIVVIASVLIFMALGALGQGDPRGLTSLILPIAILILVNQRAAKSYLKGPR
ncbi:hypothetical protein [Kineosporia babensis]|uniref:Uncharacterized protein n=1 Tax=Kineosporia babensis TaxID=499548 RepID=A0A9X1N9L1_9ACTN|nr:hypothetical protein [Kineosporia babensis]MCD5309736.1 hypothetical protein [Kineosporia babensis]